MHTGLNAGLHGLRRWSLRFVQAAAIILVLACNANIARAQDVKIVKSDTQIDALDPGIKLFVREKMAEGNTRFTDDNVVLFLHGATAPSTCDSTWPTRIIPGPTGW